MVQRTTHSAREVDKFGSGKDGFTEGDPLVPTPRTVAEAIDLDQAQECIVRTVEAANIALASEDYDQFVAALKWAALTPFSFEGIAYTRKRYAVTSEGTPESAYIASDGTSLFVLMQGDGIHQYTLATPWDVSTASYDSASMSVTTQEANPRGMAFKSDGTSVYVTGGTGYVYQYDLGTAWDISTGSYASKSVNVGPVTTAPYAVQFRAGGTTMHVLEDITTSEVFEYTLSTAWDVSTATYASRSKNLTGEETAAKGFGISDDGLAMFVCGDTGNDVTEYLLSTAWDVSTATATGRTYSVAYLTAAPNSMAFVNDGRAFLITEPSNDTIFQLSSMA